MKIKVMKKVVYVTSDMFSNGVARILCPYCGKGNVLPLCAVNREVECGSCDRPFQVQLTESGAPHTNASATQSSAKTIWTIISLIGFGIFLLWSFPSFLSIFRDVTGSDLGLGKIIYDDNDCCLEVTAALSEENYALAMKWAKRIKDPRLRRISIANVKDCERIHRDFQSISY